MNKCRQAHALLIKCGSADTDITATLLLKKTNFWAKFMYKFLHFFCELFASFDHIFYASSSHCLTGKWDFSPIFQDSLCLYGKTCSQNSAQITASTSLIKTKCVRADFNIGTTLFVATMRPTLIGEKHREKSKVSFAPNFLQFLSDYLNLEQTQ